MAASRTSLGTRESASDGVVVGVDPPASAAGTCGIVVCGKAPDGIAMCSPTARRAG